MHPLCSFRTCHAEPHFLFCLWSGDRGESRRPVMTAVWLWTLGYAVTRPHLACSLSVPCESYFSGRTARSVRVEAVSLASLGSLWFLQWPWAVHIGNVL